MRVDIQAQHDGRVNARRLVNQVRYDFEDCEPVACTKRTVSCTTKRSRGRQGVPGNQVGSGATALPRK